MGSPHIGREGVYRMVEKRQDLGELMHALLADKSWSIGDQFLRLRLAMSEQGVRVTDCPWDIPMGRPVLACAEGHWRLGRWGEG